MRTRAGVVDRIARGLALRQDASIQDAIDTANEALAIITEIQDELSSLLLSGAYSNITLALAGGTVGKFVSVVQAGLYAVDVYSKTSSTALLYYPSLTYPIGAGITANTIINTAPTYSSPVTCFLSIDPIFGKFSDGRYIPATYPSALTHNAYPGIHVASNSGGTFTPNYTTDSDGLPVHRWQMSAHAHILFLSGVLINSVATQGRYFIKSNTGGGTHNVTAGLNSARDTYSINEATWTEVTFNKTAGVSDTLTVYNSADIFPIDMLIKDQIQLYYDAETPPSTEPARQYSVVPYTAYPRPGTITFGDGNSMLPSTSNIRVKDAANVGKTMSAGSYVIAFREDGTSGTSAAVMFTPSATGIDFYTWNAGTQSNALAIRAPGIEYIGQSIRGQGWILVGARFDGTSSQAFLENVQMKTDVGHVPVVIPNILFGGGGGVSPGDAFVGSIGPLRMTDQKLSDTQMQQMFLHVKERLTDFGAVIPTRNWYVAEGDSITANDADGVHSYAYQSAASATFDPRRNVFAVPGSTTDTVIARLPTVVAAIARMVALGGHPVFTMMIGSNPEAPGTIGTISKLQTIWSTIRATGAAVIAMTIPFRGDGAFTLAQWNAYNTAIRAQSAYYDALVDVAADANFQTPTNLTYFNADTLHLSGVGQTYLATLVSPKIAAQKV